MFSLLWQLSQAQENLEVEIFSAEPVNYKGDGGQSSHIERLQNGRLIFKKVTVPDFPDGSDVHLKLVLRSDGDRWDKSGSCFVVSNPGKISMIDIARGNKEFPESSKVNGSWPGIKASDEYEPVIELLRFMTPFGVGHFSKNNDAHRRPVYIPKWAEEVIWETDISHLLDVVDESFYVGVWIDTWTPEGYEVDLTFTYSNRPLRKVMVKPLVNTVSYVSGQNLPDFFPETDLVQNFSFDKDVKNVRLHYITSGHGGHSGGDEFTKIKNDLWVDGDLVLDIIPWRDDCASYRRFNPTSGVWLRKDSASYIDFQEKRYKIKEIEERIASSDLSRSNWCPGSMVEPIEIDLGDLSAGHHELKIDIDATKAGEGKLNHWLVSAYLTYEIVE